MLLHAYLYRFGGRQAATFCALYTLHQELQNEDAVDVYKTVTLYAAKRPGMFKTKVRMREDILWWLVIPIT